MKSSRKLTVIASLLLAGATTLTLLGVFTSEGVTEVQAQSNSSSSSNVTYRTSYVSKVIPGNNGDEIRKVYSFPGTSCFIVRTEKALTVWERRQSKLEKLKEINLETRLEELLFLDDGRTFIVHTSDKALVYSIDMVINKK